MGKMGKKFVSAIRKIFSAKSKEKKGEKSSEWGCWKSKHWKPWMSEKLQNTAPVAVSGVSQPVHPWPHTEEIKLAEGERGQSGNVCSVGAVGTVQTTEEVVQLSSSANFTGDSREVAAIKIQTAFRGYQDSIRFVHQAVLEDESKIRAIPPDCSTVMMWHLHIQRKTS